MLEEEDRWDKLKSWANVQHDIQTRLQAPDKFDQSVSLHHGPQLYHTLRHPSHIKCMTHFTSNVGENFVTHYRIGTMDHFSVWNMESRDRDAACNQRRFNIDAEVTTLMFVPKHRVYLGFGSDLVMRVYTDAMSGCKNVGSIPCDTTILCMSYNKDTDEVYAGGIGVLEKWKFSGSEHSAVAQRGEMFETELRSDEWVIDIKVDPRNKQMLALTHDGIYVVSFVSMKQTHLLQNRHEGSLRCCSFYKQREYFITGGGDGQVKVWNAVVFTQVHVFYGHRGPITGLQVHSTDPLLFSSSMDGTVQIWRMDNFSKFMRVDLGDGIHQMKLLGDEEFFCQTEKEIRIYNLNQFYTLFAPVESTVFKLQLYPSVHGRASRVLCSTEDGSVRFFSPVTGATITIVYPMPTFQVLTSFAYNRDKEKLLTILQNGDVLVFDCTTNPSKAEEVWQAASVDEEVTQLAVMALSYKNLEDEVVREIVVFGGLKNGQVSLLDADCCVMVKNLQAHEGTITCMEATTDIDDRGKQILETNTTLVTGGEEKSLKVWSVIVKPGHSGNKITLEPLIKIPCAGIPDLLSVYENTLCVTINSPDTKLYLRMYRMDGRDLENVSSLQFTELHHAQDEEHTQRMTALDKCPLLGLFATASEDGYIKVWNRHNQLVREMYFGEPLYGLCFANARGDLLVGFQSHVCLIPLTNFFPQNYLELISLQEFKDDLREPPIPYSSKVKSWFDPSKLPTFSTTLSIRNQEKKDPDIDQDILEDIEDHSDSEDSLLDSPTYKNYRLPKSKLNVQEENLLKELERKRKSVVEPDVMQYTDFTDIFNDLYKAEESPQPTDVEEGFESDIEETPRTKKSKKEKRRKSMSSIPNIHLLSPFEQALLKRKPIIALDGYIPNSVIRKQLSYRPPTPPQPQKRKDVWRPKPVPKPMPKKEVEEEEVMDLYELARRYRFDAGESDNESEADEPIVERPCNRGRNKKSKKVKKKVVDDWSDGSDDDDEDEEVIDDLMEDDSGVEMAESLVGSQFSLLASGKPLQKPLVWGEPEPSTKKSILSPWKKMTSMVRTTSNLSSTSSKRAYKPPSHRSTPNTPTKYELPSIVKHQHQHQHFVKSKAFDFGNVFDIKGPHPKSGGPGSRERTKSFRLSNMVVDEDSTDVRFKEKENRKKVIQVNDMEVMHKLMKEDFFRDLKGTPSYESILQQLLTMLDTDDADLHGKVCNYILEIHEDVGISDVYLDRIINKLSNQLTSGNIQTSIRKNGLSALSVIGKSRQDVVATILPRLIDSSTDIREEAAEALAALTGVTNKTELWNLMEEMGLQKTYSSKEDEEEALKALAMRLDVPYRPDSFTDWIGDWMDDMQSPAMYDVEDDLQLNDIEKAWGGREKRWKPESLYLSESVSRASNRLKELSFISDKSLLEEDRLSFLSFQSEAEEDSLSDISEMEENTNPSLEQPPGHLPGGIGGIELCVGNQVLRIPEKLSQLLQDTDPKGLFSHIQNPGTEEYTNQMAVIEQILRENPDFSLSDLEFDSDLSGLTGAETQEEQMRTEDSQMRTQEGQVRSQVGYSSLQNKLNDNKEWQNVENAGGTQEQGVQVGNNLELTYEEEDRNLQKEERSVDGQDGKDLGGWTPGTTTRTRMDFRNELENLKESVDGQGPQSPRRISRGRSDKEDTISTQNDGFDPRDPHLHRYYRNQYKRPGSGRPIVGKRGGALDRFGRLGDVSDVDGHLRSQGELDSSITQPEDITTDSMSGQDSGIGGELSVSTTSRSSKGQLVSSHPSFLSTERSQGHSSKGVGRKRSKLSDWSRTQLSPVKSSSSLHKSAMSTPRFSRDWQKFFNTPTAQERKRMDMVKKDFTEGKVKHPVSATINYISDDLPMLPGEAGLRLLHKVKVGEKVDEKHEQRHQVEAIPGKLSSQTKNENHGQAQYGILSMQWITDIPVTNAPYVSTPRFQPRSEAGSSMSQVTERSQDAYTVKSMGRETSRLPRLAQKYSKLNVSSREKSRRDTDDESFYLPSIPGAYTPDFVWEHPLPPPPPRESRTNVASINKQQEEYYKYYSLIKRNMQKYTSNVPSLPKVDIKQAIPTSKLQKSLTKMSKLSRGPSLFFPRITLNQLISST
ncbi:uncharacterized protein LOC134264735 isoform X3 [Saccostrea cucullata]|uniref:uncharacterized protein LOC134264735 isoform X3 n=1 Tax=Saccostrea cuccullata TaxID=36930 RepID=UPI002ED5B175